MPCAQRRGAHSVDYWRAWSLRGTFILLSLEQLDLVSHIPLLHEIILLLQMIPLCYIQKDICLATLLAINLFHNISRSQNTHSFKTFYNLRQT